MRNAAFELNEHEMSLLFDMGQMPARCFDAAERAGLRRLHDAGFVKRCDDEAPIFALTEKGIAALNARRVLAEA
jgi:hypothetical protein